MKRTEYHREYYWRNVHRRRRQRVESKKRCQWRSEEIQVGTDAVVVSNLMRMWR